MPSKFMYVLGAAAVMAAWSGASGAVDMPSTAQMAQQLSKGDQQILIAMAQANMAEVDTAKIALNKSSNDNVKKFAQMMVDDHSKALKDVQNVAQSKNITLPLMADAAHRAEAVKLQKLSGPAFDKAYMANAGVGDHTKVRDALKKDASAAQDADVKALATKMLPTVEQHLAMAKSTPQ